MSTPTGPPMGIIIGGVVVVIVIIIAIVIWQTSGGSPAPAPMGMAPGPSPMAPGPSPMAPAPKQAFALDTNANAQNLSQALSVAWGPLINNCNPADQQNIIIQAAKFANSQGIVAVTGGVCPAGTIGNGTTGGFTLCGPPATAKMTLPPDIESAINSCNTPAKGPDGKPLK